VPLHGDGRLAPGQIKLGTPAGRRDDDRGEEADTAFGNDTKTAIGEPAVGSNAS